MPLDHTRTRDRATARGQDLGKLVAALVCAFILSVPILTIAPASRADPTPGTNPDMTRTLTWGFDNSANYSLTNTTVSGGFGSLVARNETVAENTRADYLQGVTRNNVDLDTFPNSIMLNQSASPVTRVVIQPGPTDGKDSYLLQNWPNQNYGGLTSMMIESLDTKNDRPLMQFNLSSIPSNAIVQDAALYINFLKNNRPNPVTFNINALTIDWVEMEVNWSCNNATTYWTVPGGTYNPTPFYRGITDGAQGWFVMNISRLVELWVKGVLDNYGLIMVPDNGDNTASWKYFYASEELTVELRPKLIINYTIPNIAGTYESRAFGPGTNSTFTLASWSAMTYSKVTDEFSGTTLSPKWSWINKAPSFDVGITRPGWMHMHGDASTQLSNTTLGANFLYQNVTGSFTSATHVNASNTASTQGAGILVEDNPLDWVSISLTGIGASARISMIVSQQGTISELGSYLWSSSEAYLRIDRIGGSLQAYLSSDGTNWILLGACTPTLPLMQRLRVGLFLYSGPSANGTVADYEFMRALPIESLPALSITARLGNSTSLADPSWEAWPGNLPTMSGSMIGRTGQYIQYRLDLTSPNDWSSTQFTGFECHYERYASYGEIFTNDVGVSHLRRWLTITTTESLGGGSVNYSFSTDHGATWTSLETGSNSITSSVPFMMIKAVLRANDTLRSPLLDSIVATYAVAASSFYLVTPASVLAGDQFTVDLAAKDEANATIIHWTGSVALQAMDAAGTSPASALLAVTSAWISTGGSVSVGDESYPAAETIRIRASADGVSSLSEPIAVLRGPVESIQIDPGITTMTAFSAQAFTATAFDIIGNPVNDTNFTWSVDASLGTINATTGATIVLTVGGAYSSGWMNVSAEGITASRFITVVPVQYPPQISSALPDQIMPEDYGEWTLNITSYVTDADTPYSSLRWYTTNESVIRVRGENRTGNMVITFDTIQDRFGGNLLNLVVVDTEGLMVVAPLYVEITPVNDAPTIDTIEPLVVHVGAPYIYNFQYYVHDVDNSLDELSLSVDVASRDHCLVDRLTISFEYGSDFLDTTQTVVVTVTDQLLSASTAVIIRVSTDGIPIIIASLHDLTLNQGESHPYEYDLSQVFRDPDKGDVLYYATGNNHVEIAIANNGSVNVTAPTDWYGTEYVVFQASDLTGARAEIAVEITVLEVDKPPVVGAIPNLVVHYDRRYEFDISPYVYDPDETIDELDLTLDDLHGYFIGPVLSLLYPYSMNGRTVTVNITVSDDTYQVTRQINVTISEHMPPTVSPATPDHTFLEDNEVDYPMGAGLDDFFTAPDGVIFSYFAFSSDPEVNATARYDIIESAWKVKFEVTENYNGITDFTIRAIDDMGAIVEHTCALDIIPVPDPPTLNITDQVYVREGSQFVLNVAEGVTDPDSSMQDGDFTFQVRIAEGSTGGREEYLEHIKVLPGTLVFDFPEGFTGGAREKRFAIEVRVIDQDGKVGSSVMTVTVQKIAQQSNNLLLVGMLIAGASAIGIFAAVTRIRKKPFYIRDMMLIHNDGFLIGRYAGHSHVEGEIDQDILSGMLTAVLNFVEDSTVTHDELKTFGFKEFQALVKRGKNCFVALVYEGDLPETIDKPLSQFLGTFERVYKKKMTSWTGDIETDFAGVELLIQSFVKQHSKRSGGKAKKLWVSQKTENGGATAK